MRMGDEDLRQEDIRNACFSILEGALGDIEHGFLAQIFLTAGAVDLVAIVSA